MSIVYVSNQTDYQIKTSEIKNRIGAFLSKKNSKLTLSIDISIIDKKEMAKICQKFLNENKTHNVLSFPDSEIKGSFKFPQDNILRLGEVVVCYPLVIKEAKLHSELTGDRLYYLIEHGVRHLFGEHHK